MIFLLSIVLNFYLLMLVAITADADDPMATAVMREGDEKQVVAVYTVAGMIDARTAGLFDAFCSKVMGDRNVKAVVIRVNSSGGTVAASDQIHNMVGRLKEAGKKVVVSMGDMATSGGYYISAAADRIFVEPTTITGSIGAIAQWPVVKGTFEKIGLEMIVVKSRHADEWKDDISPFRKPNQQQLDRIRQLLDKIQARFEQVVKEGRSGKLTPALHEAGAAQATQPAPEYEAFNGKVYLADEARELGLADADGYIENAIDAAGALAGLTRPKVVKYSRRKGFVEKLLSAEAAGGVKLDANFLDQVQTPRILLMWKAD
jgi:protease-4